jgi:hypothetical protein
MARPATKATNASTPIAAMVSQYGFTSDALHYRSHRADVVNRGVRPIPRFRESGVDAYAEAPLGRVAGPMVALVCASVLCEQFHQPALKRKKLAWRLRTRQGGCSRSPHDISPESGMVTLFLFRQSPDGELAQAPGGKPAAYAVLPSEGKVSPFARCARQACSFSFLGEDTMFEAFGIVLVALAVLALLFVISRLF